MERGWRVIAKTVALTAALTTAFWFAVALWWYQRAAPGAEPRPSAPSAPLREMLLARSDAQPGQDQGGGRMTIPVAGVRAADLVDTFTQARASGARAHDAIDIVAPRGTPVVAAAPGRVEKLFVSKDGGNTVYVRAPDGRRLYYYAHLDGYAPGLAEGAALRTGAPLGIVGATGNADPATPHLHFAIWATEPQAKWWDEGEPLNPYPLLRRAP